MARIFLSHSSLNNGEAVALRDWLVAEGWDDLFLDLDPKRGIRAGERWERALHEALSRCAAAVFLVSNAWLASEWCRKEFDIAGKLCGHLFVVLIEDIAVKDLPHELISVRQMVDLAKGADYAMLRATLPEGREQHVTFAKGGLQGLKAGLVAAGLDPRFFAWPPENDPERAPYRGLLPLEAEDAGIFLGREAPIVDVLERLRKLRESGPPRFLVILGASGAGKSSFLRAGLIPRLARDDRNFLMLPVIRPERAVMSGDAGLLRGLERAGNAHGLKQTRAEIKKLAARGADALRPLLAALAKSATLTGEAEPKAPSLVIAIDQAEELFQAEGAEEADAFLKLLRDLLFAGEPEILVIVTIRSDSYDRLQTAGALVGLAQQPFSLLPMPTGAYQNIIEGPAARLTDTGRALKIDPQLTLALLADIEDGGAKDALPLLAFTLERLYLEHGGDGDLRLDEYRELGGINGSIEAAVERALAAADNDAAVPKDKAARLALMRRAFIPWLAGIDPETGSPRRAVARLSEIPEETRPLVKHLVDQRLLATDVSHGETTIEPAHEALLRQWGLLKGWLNEDFAQLAALEAVRRATRDWLANDRSPDWLAHTAGRLEDAERLKARPDLAAKMGHAEADYLTACRDAETQRKERELRQAKKLTRAIAMGLIAAMILAAVAAGFGYYGFQKAKEAEEQATTATYNEGIALSGLSRVALAEDLPMQSLKLALAAWPRIGDERRPQLRRTIETLVAAIPQSHQRTVLRGHTGQVRGAAFSPDGTRVVTVSADKTARLWDVKTGAEVAVLDDHEPEFSAAAFSPDGKRVVMIGRYAGIRLWDAASGSQLAAHKEEEPPTYMATSPDATLAAIVSQAGAVRVIDIMSGKDVAVLDGHDRSVNSVTFSPDGTRVVTSAQDNTARVWDIKTGLSIVTLIGHEESVVAADFSPDAKLIVTASWDKTARLWDAQTGKELAVMRDHEAAVVSAIFSPDATQIVTTSWDKTARLWDTATGRQVAALRHENEVKNVSFSPDGALLLTMAETERVARIWTTRTGKLVAVLKGHEGWLSSAAFSPVDRTIVTSSFDNTARLWDTRAGEQKLVLRGAAESALTAALSPDGRRIAIGYLATAEVRDAKTGATLAVLTGHDANVNAALFSPDGKQVLTASNDGTARLWDAETGATTAILKGHVREVTAIAFSPDGTRIVTAAPDEAARLWDARSGEQIAALVGYRQIGLAPGPQLNANLVAFSPDGTLLVTTSGASPPLLWDAITGSQIAILRGHGDAITSVAFSPDSRTLATASLDATVRLWDSRSGAEVAVLKGQDKIYSVAFSPNGERIAAASQDSTARIWDTKTASETAILRGHSGFYSWLGFVAFSPDGTRVVTTSRDDTVRLWDAESGAEVAVLWGHENEVTSAAFSLDASRLLTVADDRTARLWDISSVEKGDIFAVACQRLGQNTDLADVRERYGLGGMVPICGANAPSPVDREKLQ